MQVELHSGKIVSLNEYYKRMEVFIPVPEKQRKELEEFRNSTRKQMSLPPFQTKNS